MSVVYNCLLLVVETVCCCFYLEMQNNKLEVINVEHSCIFRSVLWLQVLFFLIWAENNFTSKIWIIKEAVFLWSTQLGDAGRHISNEGEERVPVPVLLWLSIPAFLSASSRLVFICYKNRASSKANRIANNSKGSFSYLLVTLCPALSNDTIVLQTSAILRHPWFCDHISTFYLDIDSGYQLWC